MEGNEPQGHMGGTPQPEHNQGQTSHQGQDSHQGQAPSQSSAPSSTSDVKQDVKGMVGQLEALLDEYMVKNAPFALPLGLKEFIVKVSPYLILIFSIIGIVAILGVIGLSTMMVPLAVIGGYKWGVTMIISTAASAIVIVMQLMAVSGLFKRTKRSWRLIFWASIVNVIGSLIALNIIGAILSAIIGWYVIFQVKDMYKNE